MAATLMTNAPVFQRKRNNSGGSTGSSVSSMDTDMSSPLLTPTSPFLQMRDIHTIANLLSVQPTTVPTEQTVKSLASRYKTELCRSYEETGFCKYGEKCQFAHGSNEMKCLPRHPKYKSELCRTFHTTGFCPYGMRCHFIHSEDESKLTEINLMKQQAAARQATQQMLQQAARLKLQQQALQQQMQTIMLSQLNLQQPTPKPVASQHRAAYYPQLSVPTVNHHVKPVVERGVSVPGNMCSVLDTPPVTPPCGSPTFDMPVTTGKVVSPPPGFAPKSGAVFEEQSAISSTTCMNLNFNNTASDNVNKSDVIANHLNNIVSRMGSIDLESVSSDVYTPSTSPESMIQSPLDSPRSGRLPVFSQIVA